MDSGRGGGGLAGRRTVVGTFATLFAVATLGTLVIGPLGGVAVASQDAADVGGVDVAQVQAPPTANLTVSPNPAHPGEEIVLDARNSTAPGGSIRTCEFDVDGDGTYDAERQDCLVDYPYYATGEYEIRVRVTTTDDRTATDSAILVVRENEQPSVTIAVDRSAPRPGDEVRLAAEASDRDGTVAAYRWRIRGENRTGETVSTTFDAVGDYEVTLTAVDDDGASASAETTVSVRANRPPTANLALGTDDPTVGEPVRLDASGTTDPEDAVVEYRWDLDGDGSVDRTTSGPTTDVEVGTAGEYAVRVTAVDDRDATDAATVRFGVAPAGTAGGDSTGVGTDDPGGDEPAGIGSGIFGAVDLGIVPVLPDLLVALLVLAVGAVAGVAVRWREAVASQVQRLRDLLTRGDVRRRLAKKLSGATVKKVAKGMLRRLSDLIEAGGEAVGDVVEGAGRAIKRGSRRVAELLRRLGS